MLRVEQLNAEDYLRYVSMGPCEVSTKSELDPPSPGSSHETFPASEIALVAHGMIDDYLSQERHVPNARYRYAIQGESQGRHAHPLARGFRVEESR